MPSPDDVVAHFAGWDLDGEARAYLAYHSRRYTFLLERVAAALPTGDARLLAIGAVFEAELLRAFIPGARVDTLGFEHVLFAPRDGERHFEVDLNDADWPTAGEHDLGVMGEVIEHLHAPPERVLTRVASAVRPGGTLLIQTPNAVALHKRLRMLAGRTPFEPIRDSRENPGHFHEYTGPELAAVAGRAGWEVIRLETVNYFSPGGAAGRVYSAAGRLLPAGMRHGITLWLRRR